MLANLIDEAIILIASILSLVVILNCESILDSHFSIQSGVALMVVADVLFFVLSASPVGHHRACYLIGQVPQGKHGRDNALDVHHRSVAGSGN